jgi:hypothetical protein
MPTMTCSSELPPLSNRERFCRLYDGLPVDRGVRWEAVGFWMLTVDAWRRNGGLPEGVDVMQHYGFDPQPTVPSATGFTSMPLSGPPVQQRMLEDKGPRQVWENDLGQVWEVRADGGESMPRWIRFPVETHQDWLSKIKPRLDPSAHDFSALDAEGRLYRDNPDPNGLWLVGLYAFWRNFWGEERLAYAFYDCPDTLRDMADTWLRMHCECSPRVLAETRVDYVLFHEDMAFKNGPLIGPNLFDEFMAPYYREVFAHLRAHGQHRFMLDSDGNNGAVLHRFAELGMNGLYPFEVAAGCDALAFREEHPAFFAWGCIDKRVLLGTKDDVTREVMGKVPALWETGRFIPSIDHSVPPCSQANFEHFLNLVRDICR